MQVDPKILFGLSTLSHIKEELGIELTDQTYSPKVDDLRSDWVATVATPAFKKIRDDRYPNHPVKSFCSIGTGAALDVLAAIEIFGCSHVSLTDIHPDVVKTAIGNVQRNLQQRPCEVKGEVGDLLTPFVEGANRFDIIYENLPNIPLAEDGDLKDGQTSSSFISQRTEQIPQRVQEDLLELHYLTLQQAKPLLSETGVVLSSIGARVPLKSIHDLATKAGYSSRLLVYTWKIQSEPEEILNGYSAWQQQGPNSFHFYPTSDLERIFSTSEGKEPEEIEKALEPYELDAEQALKAHEAGQQIGHTVAVLESTPN